MSPFLWVDAESASHAVALLQAHGPHAQVIAAGGDLLGLLKEDIAGPTRPGSKVLINLATAPDLALLTRHTDGWRIGAMVTLQRLAQAAGVPAMLPEAIAKIASPQLRVTTTVGGNLLQRPRCLYFRHPDIECFKKGGAGCPAASGPAAAYPGAVFPGACHAGHPSDLAPVLMALNAQAEVLGPTGARTVPLANLYRDAGLPRDREAALERADVLTAVLVPHHDGAQAFEKIAPRAANEFSWAGAAVACHGSDGSISAIRIVLSGIAPGPYLVERAHDSLLGRRVRDIDALQTAGELVPIESITGFAATRAPAARLAIERALSRALQQLRSDPSRDD